MSDDIANEVHNLFVNHTVDQVVVKCADVKKQIHSTQEELRRLVGSRYRELLEACDKVVGMDAICEAIKHRAEVIRVNSGTGSSHNHRQSIPRGGSDAALGGDAEVKVDAQQVSDAILAADLAARLHSIHVLCDHRHLFDAAARYRSVVRVLHDVEGTINDAHFAAARRAAVPVPQRIMTAVAQVIQGAIGKESIMRPAVLEVYNDIHSAIEQLFACTSQAAVEKLISMHRDVIVDICRRGMRSSQDAATSLVHVIAALCNCLYFLHHCKTISGGLQAQRLGAEELAALDPNDPQFMAIVSLQVLGLGAMQEAAPSKGSGIDGWALSPSVAPPPATDIDRSLVDQLQKWAQERFAELPELLADVRSVVSVEADVEALLAQLKETVAVGVYNHQELALHISATLSARVVSHIREGIASAAKECDSACDELAAAAGSPGTPVSSTAATDVNSRVSSLVHARLRLRASGAAPAGRTQPSQIPAVSGHPHVAAVAAKLGAAVQNIAEALQRASARGGSEAALAAREVLDVVCKEFARLVGGLQQRVARARASDEASALFRVSRLVSVVSDTVDATARLFESAELRGTGLAATAAELAELQNVCHSLWIRDTASSFADDLVAAAKYLEWHLPTKRFLALLASSWDVEKVDDALVQIPNSCTAPTFAAVARMQQRVRAFDPVSLKAATAEQLHRAVADAASDAFDRILSQLEHDHGALCEEALLQLYYDARFVALCYMPSNGFSQGFRRFFKRLEAGVDVVNWSVSYALIDARTAAGVAASQLSLGLFRSAGRAGTAGRTSGAGQSASAALDLEVFKVKLLPEAPRVSLLPIATPAATTPSALLAGSSKLDDALQQGAASAANGGPSRTASGSSLFSSTGIASLKGIRSAFSWTS